MRQQSLLFGHAFVFPLSMLAGGFTSRRMTIHLAEPRGLVVNASREDLGSQRWG